MRLMIGGRSRVKWCALLLLFVSCLFPSSCSVLGTRTLTGNHGPANLSLEIKSDLALFAIQNSTHGIIISITPLCFDHICSSPHSLLVEGVFLPDECTVVPCSEHLLINTTALSDSTVQYVIGVPSVQSLLLLRFYYHVKLHVFELKEKVIASKGIMDCNPTAVTFVNEVYFTLCVNGSESRFLVYSINLEDFSDVIFSQTIDNFSTLTLPIADVAALSGILDNFILFVGGTELIVIYTDEYTFERNYFDECTGEIYQISPRNTSEMEDTIPFLLYCDSDYGVIDVLEIDSSDPLRYYYNKTGYPVVCRNRDIVVSEITTFADRMNNTLKHNANNFTLPGRQILLKTSLCFAVEDTLFYLYSDRVLGSVMVSLRGDDLRVLFSEVCKWSGCGFRVVEDRYVLLTEQFNDTNARLRVYDVLQQYFVSENTLNASTSLMLLIALPQPPPNYSLAVILGSTIGGVLFLVAICVLVVTLRTCRRRMVPEPDEHHMLQEQELLLQPGVQVQEFEGPSSGIPVFPPTVAVPKTPQPPKTSPYIKYHVASYPSTPSNSGSILVPGADLPLTATVEEHT